MALLQHKAVDTAAVIKSNSNYYDAYRIAGDYCMQQQWYSAAINYYGQALKYEIATLGEKKSIVNKMEACAKLKAEAEKQ
jgi:hypothetical protein